MEHEVHLTLLMFAVFLVKHFICDFPHQIQTPWMYENKGTYGHMGGLVHAGIHAVVSALVLIMFRDLEHTFFVYLGILNFEFFVHYHMDWFKVWWCKRNNYKPDNSHAFWFWLGLDQLVHGLTYVIMVALWI